MNGIENFGSIVSSIGFGGIMGFLLGYFMRKIIKLIFFAVGGIVGTLSNANSIIESWNHIVPSGAANLGFPLTGSMAVGFTVGFLRA